mmetsp:Transcript_8948/g.33020  ORF Transcript_8948/g.33020 Transcript_8948/m.33020 type:complete len:321 (-) Transcript_8948:202-1164(-)
MYKGLNNAIDIQLLDDGKVKDLEESFISQAELLEEEWTHMGVQMATLKEEHESQQCVMHTSSMALKGVVQKLKGELVKKDEIIKKLSGNPHEQSDQFSNAKDPRNIREPDKCLVSEITLSDKELQGLRESHLVQLETLQKNHLAQIDTLKKKHQLDRNSIKRELNKCTKTLQVEIQKLKDELKNNQDCNRAQEERLKAKDLEIAQQGAKIQELKSSFLISPLDLQVLKQKQFLEIAKVTKEHKSQQQGLETQIHHLKEQLQQKSRSCDVLAFQLMASERALAELGVKFEHAQNTFRLRLKLYEFTTTQKQEANHKRIQSS